MKKETEIVIFRKFQGEIISLFPSLPGNSSKNTCQSYAFNGEHSPADTTIMRYSTKATEAEYSSLKSHLEDIGYNLKVVTKFTQKHLEKRINALKNKPCK